MDRTPTFDALSLSAETRARILGRLAVLGVTEPVKIHGWFHWRWEDTGMMPDEIQALLEEWQHIREARMFSEADEMKAMMSKHRILFENTRLGPAWRTMFP